MTRRSVAFTLLLLVTVVVYWPGLSGEFIFDDVTNFNNLERWLQGLVGWQAVVLEHSAGPLGRSVAMATFLANAALSGMDPFFFKLTNLLVHLVTGGVIYLVLKRLARRDPVLGHRPDAAALVVTAVWLLHPLMVGTVLYSVQRMAMLSALFMLLAVLAYLIGRHRIESGDGRSGAVWIAAGVPLFTLLAALSKENGLLAPMLCAVIEWVYFRPDRGRARPKLVRGFLWLGVGLPVLAGVLMFAFRPEFFLQGFENRPFSVGERLLTQGRVLFDYIGQLLLPIGSNMSLFRDDYTISSNLLDPMTTLAAWLGWVLLIGLALRARRHLPAYTAGVGLFLVGHAMESSLFPLLIYFEHRNYLPAVGVFWAAAGVLTWSGARIRGQLDHPEPLARGAIAALLIVLVGATFARASLWQSNEAVLDHSIQNFPDSRAARLQLAQIEMNRMVPDVDAAQAQYYFLLSLDRPSTQLIGSAGLLASACHAGTPVEPQALETLRTVEPESLEADVLSALTSLTELVLSGTCAAPGATELAARILQLVDISSLPSEHVVAWQLRYRAAQLYEQAGEALRAGAAAERAWQGRADQLPVALLLLRLAFLNDDLDTARELVASIENLLPEDDRIGQQLLRQYQSQLDSG